jgi:outer membrane protein TolC
LSKLQSSTPLSKIAEAKMRLADATLKQTRSAWLPSLDASYEWNKMFEPYGDATAQSSSAYLTLTVPLSSRMTSTRAYRTAIKERAASELEYDAALAGEAKRFEAERQLLQSLWRETQNWQRHVQKAESLYLQSSERFEKGYSTVNDLNLDARRLADIQETEISAWQDVHLKMFSLCKLSGNSCLDMLD